MTIRQLIKKFVEGIPEGTELKAASMRANSEELYSYATVICRRKGDTFYVNNARFSVTTSKQQSYLRYELVGRKTISVHDGQRGTKLIIQ